MRMHPPSLPPSAVLLRAGPPLNRHGATPSQCAASERWPRSTAVHGRLAAALYEGGTTVCAQGSARRRQLRAGTRTSHTYEAESGSGRTRTRQPPRPLRRAGAGTRTSHTSWRRGSAPVPAASQSVGRGLVRRQRSLLPRGTAVVLARRRARREGRPTAHATAAGGHAVGRVPPQASRRPRKSTGTLLGALVVGRSCRGEGAALVRGKRAARPHVRAAPIERDTARPCRCGT